MRAWRIKKSIQVLDKILIFSLFVGFLSLRSSFKSYTAAAIFNILWDFKNVYKKFQYVEFMRLTFETTLFGLGSLTRVQYPKCVYGPYCLLNPI